MHMRKETDDRPGFYEFFCGGGMARLGLGQRRARSVGCGAETPARLSRQAQAAVGRV